MNRKARVIVTILGSMKDYNHEPVTISFNKNKIVEFVDKGETVRIIGKEVAFTINKNDFETGFKEIIK